MGGSGLALAPFKQQPRGTPPGPRARPLHRRGLAGRSTRRTLPAAPLFPHPRARRRHQPPRVSHHKQVHGVAVRILKALFIGLGWDPARIDEARRGAPLTVGHRGRAGAGSTRAGQRELAGRAAPRPAARAGRMQRGFSAHAAGQAAPQRSRRPAGARQAPCQLCTPRHPSHCSPMPPAAGDPAIPPPAPWRRRAAAAALCAGPREEPVLPVRGDAGSAGIDGGPDQGCPGPRPLGRALASACACRRCLPGNRPHCCPHPRSEPAFHTGPPPTPAAAPGTTTRG